MHTRICFFAVLLWSASLCQAGPISTSFSYQGELKQLGAKANGAFDFQFGIFDIDVGGAAIGSSLLLENVSVVEGVFTVELDFGVAPYAGDQLWLQVGVRDGASVAAHTILLPRQKITAVPYALHAEFVAMNAVGGAEVDSSQVQLRVAGNCTAGASIRAIDAAGNVLCESGTAIFGTFVAGSLSTPTATRAFLTPTATVDVASGQQVFIMATGAFGNTGAPPAGAGGLDIYPCYRPSGVLVVPSVISSGMWNLSVPLGQRQTFSVSGVVSGLAAGTYDVGMCGDDGGNGNWNYNEWGYVSVLVFN